jgi:hypothetical protein
MRTLITLMLMLVSVGFGAGRGRYDYTNLSFANAIQNSNTLYIHPGMTSAQIQAALDKAHAAGGGHVICLSGNYVLSSRVIIHDNTTLEFLRPNSIRVSDTHTLDTVGGYHVWNDGARVQNIAALIQSENPSTTGSSNIHIIGATIDFDARSGDKFAKNKWYAGIWLGKTNNSSVRDCKVENVVTDNGTDAYQSFGILVTDSNSVTVRDCEANYCGYEGFGIRGDNHYVTVENCCGENNVVYLAQAARVLATNSSAISGEYSFITFRNLWSVSNGAVFHAATGFDTKPHNLLMENNRLSKLVVIGHANGVQLVNNIVNVCYLTTLGGETLENVYLTGNIIGTGTEPRSHRVRIEPAGTTGSTIQNIFINNNVIEAASYNDGSARVRSAVNMTCSATATVGHIIKNVVIDNNIFTTDIAESTTGLPVILISNSRTGYDWTDITLSNNQFIHTKYSTYIMPTPIQAGATSTGNIVRLNIVNNTFAPDFRRLLYIPTGGTGAVKDVLIQGNLIDSDATYPIIYAVGNLNRTRMIGNTVLGCKYILQQTTGTVSDFLVQDNDIQSITTSFLTGTVSNLTIRGNNTSLPIAKTADYTIPLELNGATFTNSGDDGAIVFTLPAAIRGLEYTFVDVVNTAGVDLTIDGNGAEEIGTLGTTAVADDDVIQSITIYCLVDGKWEVKHSTGTWE